MAETRGFGGDPTLGLSYVQKGEGFELSFRGIPLLRHSPERPAILLGESRLRFSFFKGNFRIRDGSRARPLPSLRIEETLNGLLLDFSDGKASQRLIFREEEGLLRVLIEGEGRDRLLVLRLAASPEEAVYGTGEHFTKLNLRGQRVRNWVEEHIAFFDVLRKILLLKLGIRPRTRPFHAYATYHPEPCFVSGRGWFCRAETDSYAVFDFRDSRAHELWLHGKARGLVLGTGVDWPSLLESLTKVSGRPPLPPDWIHDGMILGIQGGTETCSRKLDRMRSAGAAVNGIWAQDWCGQRRTYFGTQLRWDYRWDRALYPDLDAAIPEWQKAGVRFLGYANPYLAEDGIQFKEAASRGFLARNRDGSVFLTKSTSFPFGIVDFSNPEAYAWFKDILKKELLGLGLAGWMADFGEYLPTDAVLKGGASLGWHNAWPRLWARINREALEETGRLGQALFFTRSGYSGSSAYSTMAWNGDQHVDWSEDFGIASVVRASLSLGLSGMPLCHSDVGGYTTVPGITRSKELYLRWLELSTFSVMMRSHEGNKPEVNWQFDSDEETVAATARFSRLHAALKPYLRDLAQEAAERGLPVMRPLFFHYDENFGAEAERSFLLGRDLAVFPVLRPCVRSRALRLPKDDWLGLLDGQRYNGGEREIPAPLGKPPVFYREASPYKPLFESIRAQFAATEPPTLP